MRIGGLNTEFVVEDAAAEYRVSYSGILPDLFREGQGIIVHGKFSSPDKFEAEVILAKHDET